MKKLALAIIFSLSALVSKGQAKYYLSNNPNAQPWGTNTNSLAMNQAFGVGTWTNAAYGSVNVNALFQSTVCLIFMEGGDSHATALNQFLTTNMTALQNWVSGGGRLLINAAPNVGGNITYGFGGMLLNYVPGPWPPNCTNAPGQAGHAIFNGPFLPCGTAYTGNWWCHGYVTGPATQLIVSAGVPGSSLAELNWGGGKAMFGSMTTPNWHQPLANAQNLLANILTYLYVCCTQPTITAIASPSAVCAGFPSTLTAGGAGNGGTYTWTAPGGGTVTGATAVFNPTATGIYTVVGTNTANCQGTATIQLVVSPAATITAVPNPTAVCVGQTSSTITFGGGVSYTMQPGNIIGLNAVVSPPGVAIYTVTGVNASGCVASTTVQIDINPTTTATANNPTACVGTPINFNAGGGTTYVWAGPNGFTSNLQSPSIPSASLNMSGQYTVTVTSALGCSNTAVSVVSVSPLPNPGITHNAPNGICYGGTLSLTGTGGGTYAWAGPNGFMSTSQTPTVGPVVMGSAGIYSLVTVVNTCSNMATTPITVHALPSPVLLSNSPVCMFEQITFTATGGITYTVNGPNGFYSNSPMANIPVANNITAGMYTLTTTDINGCTNSSTSNVMINSLPIIAAVGSTVCAEQTVFLSVSGGTSYAWTGPLNFVSTSTNPTIADASLPMAGNYTVSVVDINGCRSTSVTNVVVNPLPSPSATASSPICSGEDIQLTATDAVAIGYVWNGPKGYFTLVQNPVVKAAGMDMAGIYTLTATDGNGCGGKAVVNVLINPLPVASVISSKQNGCVPVCATFSTQSSAQLQQITWKLNNSATIGTGTEMSNCFKNAGNYTIKAVITDINGCANTSDPFEVNAYPIPVADFNITPSKPVVNDDIEFSDASRDAIVTQWSWYFTDQKNNVALSQNPHASYENAGAYPIALIVKSDRGCVDSIVKSVVVGEDFSIYVPNAFTPNNDGVNDVFIPKGFGITKFEMNIFDRWGNKIFTSTSFENGWNGTRKGDEILEDGVYVWKISVTNVFGKSKDFTGHVTLTR